MPDNLPAAETTDEPHVMPREFEIGAVRWFSATVSELARALHPLLAQVRRVELSDIPRPPEDGSPLPPAASPLFRPMKVAHEWIVSVEDVVRFNVDQFLTDLYAAADNTGSQMVRGFLGLVADVTEQTGNVIDGAGRDFFDVFADSLETIEMTFDDEGRPKHTLVMHPEQLAKLEGKKPTPTQEARLEALMQRKREEWNASRRRRNLP